VPLLGTSEIDGDAYEGLVGARIQGSMPFLGFSAGKIGGSGQRLQGRGLR